MPVRLANWLNRLTALLVRYKEHSAQQRDGKTCYVIQNFF